MNDPVAVSTKAIEVRDISKTYKSTEGPIHALSKVNFSVNSEEFISIVGRSGCGKTTLLRILGGLIKPTTGEVKINDQIVKGPERRCGFIFQKPVLLAWRTVLENLLLPAEIMGLKISEQRQIARDWLNRVGLRNFENVMPRQLSGGMQQRAAVARSLMYDPEILLMDEPFGALDALTRQEMHIELQRIWHENKKIVIFVTHDIAEAVFLSDRIIVLSDAPGRIVRIFDVPLLHPRIPETRYSKQFGESCQIIWEVLNQC